MIRHAARIAVVLGSVAMAVPSASAQMTFVFTKGTGASDQMIAGFQQAAALWSSHFNDPITLNVTIQSLKLPAGQIGGTSAFYDSYSYTNLRNALVNDRHSADDFSSTSHLQPGATFSMLINKTANDPGGVVSSNPYFDTGLGGPGQAGPENNNILRMTSANAKALGLMAGNDSGQNATITMTTLQQFDFNRSNGITPGTVDFVGVAAHELGHMLGFVSGVDVLAGNAAAPGLNDNQLKFVTPIDLYRYSSRSIGAGGGIGVNDWTLDNTSKYFSVDGGQTSIAPFATGTSYEASHWVDNLGLGIMDPSAASGEFLSIGNNDLRAFDVMGYDLTPTPEPSSAIVLGVAGAFGILLRRQEGQRRFG